MGSHERANLNRPRARRRQPRADHGRAVCQHVHPANQHGHDVPGAASPTPRRASLCRTSRPRRCLSASWEMLQAKHPRATFPKRRKNLLKQGLSELRMVIGGSRRSARGRPARPRASASRKPGARRAGCRRSRCPGNSSTQICSRDSSRCRPAAAGRFAQEVLEKVLISGRACTGDPARDAGCSRYFSPIQYKILVPAQVHSFPDGCR